jgi:hypothetical protein
MLNDLSDVTITAAGSNDFLQYVGGTWADRTPTQVASTLAIQEMSDISGGFSGDDVLLYTGFSFLPTPRSNLLSLGTVSDVSLTSPINGDLLTYSGGTWVNSPPSGGLVIPANELVYGTGIGVTSSSNATYDVASLGQIRLGDGIEGAPAYSFGAAGAMGMWKNGTALSWSTSAAEGLRLAATGGDVTVMSNLRVGQNKGALAVSALIGYNRTANGVAQTAYYSTAGTTIGARVHKASGTGGMIIENVDDSYMSFETNNTERGRFTNIGRFGIGTPTPEVLLDIEGATGTVVLIDNAAYYGTENAAGDNKRLLGVSAGNHVYMGAVDDVGGNVYIREDGNDVITIAAGDLGIGTASPSYEVDIHSAEAVGRMRFNHTGGVNGGIILATQSVDRWLTAVYQGISGGNVDYGIFNLQGSLNDALLINGSTNQVRLPDYPGNFDAAFDENVVRIDPQGDLTHTSMDDFREDMHPVIHLPKDVQQNVGGANGTVTYISWDATAVKKDAGFVHEDVTNPTRIQVDSAGRYRLDFVVSATQSGADRTTLMTHYRIDGSTVVTRGRQRNFTRGSIYGDVSVGMNTELDLTAGQYIEVAITVDDTDATYTLNTINAECELILRRM